MRLKALKKIDVKDPDLSKNLGWIKEFLDQFSGTEFLTGNLIEAEFTASGLKAMPHKLGVTPTGWFILDTNSGANVWRSSWDDKFITLESSAAVNIKIWVF